MTTAPNIANEDTPIRYQKEAKRREAIRVHGSIMEVLIQMAEGNPGAITVLSEIVKNDDSGMQGLMPILSLDDMDIRGAQIWVAYKDHCKSDIKTLLKAIKDRDPAMVATVNACRGCGDVPPAVTAGASFRR